MGDAAQSNTRNLYQKKFAFLEYRDGAGRSYAEQIRLQSWMNADDIRRRRSRRRAQVEGGGYDIPTRTSNRSSPSPATRRPTRAAGCPRGRPAAAGARAHAVADHPTRRRARRRRAPSSKATRPSRRG